MAFSTVTLQQLFPDLWGDDLPGNLVDLVNAEYGDLDENARRLRRLAMDLVHSFERIPVLTARNALELLEKKHLPCRRGLWTAVALDSRRERVYVPNPDGGLRLLHANFRSMPHAAKLQERAPLPQDGSYLLIFGGSVDELTGENLSRYASLKKTLPVADVLLWEQGEHSATFWSVKAGQGQRGAEPVEFPNPDTLRRWQAS